MNIERLNAIIDTYIDQFDVINNDDHFENMKWVAVHHFKKNFDINATDFYEMFKYAMSESSIIINNGTVQPVNGVLKLIGYEPETMRNLFAMLYADDGGDLDKRQSKIEHFVDEANKLLEKYERGKWKYKQDFRSVLAYLVFYQPEQNYFYKSSQSQPFFRYLEYGEEIGYGQYFKLSRYYRMCEEVREYLATHEALIARHNERWNRVGDPEDNLHILTFDIIYCSIVYGFYEYQHYMKVIKRSKADIAQQNLETEIEIKRGELEVLEADLEREQDVLDNIPEILVEGQTVRHKMFGNGKVIKQNGSYIEVEFASRTSKFIITMAFMNGFLTSEDASILERCKQLEAAIDVCGKLEKAIKSKQTELDTLIAKLMK